MTLFLVTNQAPEREPFDAFVQTTRDMLALAQQGEWETVTRLQAERQQRLEAYFQTPVPPALADEVAAGIREMLELDRRVMDLGRQGMDELARKMGGLRIGRRAQRAYGGA